MECPGDDVSGGISPGQLRASSRGNTLGRALFGIIGRKGRVGGLLSLVLKVSAQPTLCAENWQARVLEGELEFLV